MFVSLLCSGRSIYKLRKESQTMDIECVKYKKFKEIRTYVPGIVETSKKNQEVHDTVIT
jgi:hypothetical protein